VADARPYHRLNPLTKAALAVSVTLATLLLGGFAAPAALLGLVVLPGAAVGGVAGRVLRLALLAALPLAAAAFLVLAFGRQGGTVLFALGPLEASAEGLAAAAQVTLRLLAMAAALALFGVTTPVPALVADLERRGVSPRLAFAAAATLGAVPALVEQARVVRDAQRARGLDIDGGVAARVRGVVPLAGPVLLGALHGIEARSLALEARAFGRPGRRDLLWAPGDGGPERLLRWALLAAVVAIAAGRLTGALPPLP